jgi:HNH endonuclease
MCNIMLLEKPMPRNQPIDWDLVYEAIDSSPSLSAAARKLGLHFNTVWKATKRREGLCHLCFRTPAVPPSTHCDACREYMRNYMKQRRVRTIAARICRLCTAPLDGTSRVYCEAHRQSTNASARTLHARNKAAQGEVWMERLRGYARRKQYGAAATTAWDATRGACSICAAPYRKRHTHIHHIDRNTTNNAPDNLVVVCYRCHRLIHALLSHAQPALVIAWVQSRA